MGISSVNYAGLSNIKKAEGEEEKTLGFDV